VQKIIKQRKPALNAGFLLNIYHLSYER